MKKIDKIIKAPSTELDPSAKSRAPNFNLNIAPNYLP
jgi:hypothetical protein